MVEPMRHRQTKGAGTDMSEPKATAPHLDSTATRDRRGRLSRFLAPSSGRSGNPKATGITKISGASSKVPARLSDLQRWGGWWGGRESIARFPQKKAGRGWH